MAMWLSTSRVMKTRWIGFFTEKSSERRYQSKSWRMVWVKPLTVIGRSVAFDGRFRALQRPRLIHQEVVKREEVGVLTLSAFCNRALVVNREEVRRARRNKTFTKHLKTKIEKNSQFYDARCSSNNAQNIECFCVDVNFVNRLLPTYASNVNVISSNTVSDWLKKFEENLYDDVILKSWKIRQAYFENKNGSSMPRLTLRDRNLLK